MCFIVVFFQAEDGIRDLVRSRGLGDVYKRQELTDDVSQEINNELQKKLLTSMSTSRGLVVSDYGLSLIHI